MSTEEELTYRADVPQTEDEPTVELDPMVEVLKRERLRRDWTQADVAKKLGHLSSSTISQYENGNIVPGTLTLRRWAAVFDMEPVLRSTTRAGRTRMNWSNDLAS